MIQTATPITVSESPLRHFRGAHAGILGGLDVLRELPTLATALERAREQANATLQLFDRVVREHHAAEEQELFVSLRRSTLGDPERQRIDDMVAMLTAQHRQIEAMWSRIRPAVAHLAAGKPAGDPMFGAKVKRLVSLYEEHAQQEEQEFLPLAYAILRRNANHMAALEIALQMRHAPRPRAYI